MFTAYEMTTLRALVEQVIPADDAPGAWDAGVVDYLCRQFHGDLHDSLARYQRGLAGIDQLAQSLHGKAFAELASPVQLALLTAVDAGAVADAVGKELQEFFHLLIEHVAEGYYSDPGNGGNRGEVAWRMIGFFAHSDWPMGDSGDATSI